MDHFGRYPSKEVQQRARFVGARCIRMYVIGSCGSRRAADASEAYMMGHFMTTPGKGLNVRYNTDCRLFKDFRLHVEEVDVSAVHTVLASAGEHVLDGDDVAPPVGQ